MDIVISIIGIVNAILLAAIVILIVYIGIDLRK